MRMVIIALLVSGSIHAKVEWEKFQTTSIQLGTWMENFAQVRDSKNDSTNGFELTPFLSLSSQYSLSDKHLIIPELGWVVQETENEVEKNIIFAKLDYAFQYLPWLRLRAGSSLLIKTQSGSGGEDRLNNADTTEIYYIPEERRTTYNQTLDFGIEFIQDKSSIRFSTYTMAMFRPDERLTTVSLSYNYNIPTKELF